LNFSGKALPFRCPGCRELFEIAETTAPSLLFLLFLLLRNRVEAEASVQLAILL